MLYGYTLERRTAEQADVVGALQHFHFAESLFRILGRTAEEATAMRRRAALARLLPDEVTQAAIADVTSWTSGLPLTSVNRFSSALIPLDSTTRFSKYQNWMPYRSVSRILKFHCLELAGFGGFGADVESSNGSTARKLYSNAVSELSEVSIPLDLQEQLLAWHSKLIALNEPGLAIRVLVLKLKSIEQLKIKNESFLKEYRETLQALNRTLDQGAILTPEDQDILSFRLDFLSYGFIEPKDRDKRKAGEGRAGGG